MGCTIGAWFNGHICMLQCKHQVNFNIPHFSLDRVFISSSLTADSDIRFCVLSSLDERFDAHLAQAENLSALFVALNDEVKIDYNIIMIS